MQESGKIAEPNGKFPAERNTTPHLSRVLGLWDVVFYGQSVLFGELADMVNRAQSAHCDLPLIERRSFRSCISFECINGPYL